MSLWPFLSHRVEEAIGGRDRALEFEKRTGIERKTVQGWIDGKLPQMRVFLQFCEKVGKPPAWFFGGDEAPLAPPTADPDDMVRIPYLDVVVSAGAGRFNDVARALDHQPWPKVMIEAMGAEASIECVSVAGDSMEPTILDGALAFVDTSKTRLPRHRPRLQRPGIYAVSIGQDALVKRIDRPRPDVILLISDNPFYAPEAYHPEEVTIAGRVVGWVNRPTILG